MYQCIGVILQQCFNKEVVKKQLQEILLTARHNDAIEREVPKKSDKEYENKPVFPHQGTFVVLTYSVVRE